MSQSGTSASATRSSRSQRILACVLCQQRKVKCDRKFPCANCVRFQTECVPATLTPRRRRRRFPERDLLDRIRKYEDLLRQNNVSFDALPNDSGVGANTPSTDGEEDSEGERRSAIPATHKQSREAKDLWSVLRQQWEGEAITDGVSEAGIKRAMDQLYTTNDNILFGLRHTPIVLSSLHPDPVQIFRLWQIYLNNIDPLLKVTHTPTLQMRIIEAVSNLQDISSTLEALMFSIYAMSIMSLSPGECQATFNSPRENLLTKYQCACQQALLNCEYLRSGDRECLTAFFLFLVSIGRGTDPRSLSSMFGVALRIAYRMGIHSESSAANLEPFEMEMRRRLWWAFKLLDSRIGELADSKTIALDPIWDCHLPLNVNDTELRPDMKELPSAQGPSSDALFIVVRSAIGDFIRHAKFHLDFTNPVLKSVVQEIKQGNAPEHVNLIAFEKNLEDRYLKACSADNPLHLMTVCVARSQLAKTHLLEHYWRLSESPEDPTGAQRDINMRHAFTMLECDAQVMSSPITKGYRWLLGFYFPFPAYVHIVQELHRRPTCNLAEKAWQVLSHHFEVRVNVPEGRDSPFFDIFTKIVLSAWEAREKKLGCRETDLAVPTIVTIIKERVMQKAGDTASRETYQSSDNLDMNLDGLTMPTPMGFGNYGMFNGLGGQYPESATGFGMHQYFRAYQNPSQLPLNTMDWTFGGNMAW